MIGLQQPVTPARRLKMEVDTETVVTFPAIKGNPSVLQQSHNNVSPHTPSHISSRTMYAFQDSEASYRKVPIPPHRISPLKANWLKIYTPLVEHLKLQVRFNPKSKTIELKTSPLTVEASAIQRAADFIRAFGCGFECEVSVICRTLSVSKHHLSRTQWFFSVWTTCSSTRSKSRTSKRLPGNT